MVLNLSDLLLPSILLRIVSYRTIFETLSFFSDFQ